MDGCDRKHYARGLCRRHYERVRLTGSAELAPRDEGCYFCRPKGRPAVADGSPLCATCAAQLDGLRMWLHTIPRSLAGPTYAGRDHRRTA